MAELDGLRNQIDRIDTEIQLLFEERMKVSASIAAYKASCGMPVFDGKREEALIARLRERASDEEAADGIEEVYRTIMKVSRAHQTRLIRASSDQDDSLKRTVNLQ